MTIQIRWYDETQTIMVMQFEPDWTWDDIYELLQRGDELINGCAHSDPVDLMVDVAEIRSLKPAMNIRKLQETVSQRHQRLRFVVIHGVAPLIQPLLQSILRVLKLDTVATSAKDESDAVVLLQSMRDDGLTVHDAGLRQL